MTDSQDTMTKIGSLLVLTRERTVNLIDDMKTIDRRRVRISTRRLCLSTIEQVGKDVKADFVRLFCQN